MTLQARLTIVYVLLAVVAVAILGVAGYTIASERIRGNVDRSLEADTRAVEAGLVDLGDTITPEALELARLSLDRQALEGAVFQVLDPQGRTLLSSLGGSTPLTDTPDAPPSPGFRTLSVDGADSRSLTQPVVRVGRTVAFVETRTSLGVADASLADIRRVLIGGAAVTCLLTGIAAFFIAGRAVRPVRATAALAREIEETADFSRRLPQFHATREMEDLAATFNRMISRVQDMVATQRAFLSDTSHELRRPLTVLRTNIDVLDEPALPDDERRQVVREMRQSSESMSTLLSELLVLARSDEHNLSQLPVNLSELCEAVVATMRQTDTAHDIVSNVEGGVWVAGDSQALSRAIGNVLQNACAYSPAETRVDFSLIANDGEARLTVQDEGEGMSEDEIDHVFDRFYRGASGKHARPDGLGLGLPIVKKVVEAHQGRIVIQSVPHKGTTVAIGLPLSSG
jgi:two-component system sensor histidine kinase MprB